MRIDEEMKTVRNGIGNDLFYNWDHKRLSTVETLVSRNVDLTDSKALELGLKTKAKEVAKEGFTDLKTNDGNNRRTLTINMVR